MINVSFKIENNFAADFARGFSNAVEAGLKRVAPEGKKIIQGEIPESSGDLRSKGVSTDTGDKTITYTVSQIRDGFDYAIGVVEGTGLYGPKRKRITAKNGKALRIPIANLKNLRPETLARANNGFIFVRSIKGQRPNPFNERAAKRIEQVFPGRLADEITNAL